MHERVLGNGLECLLDVDGLFGTRFEVWDVVLTVAPLLGSPCRHLEGRHVVVSWYDDIEWVVMCVLSVVVSVVVCYVSVNKLCYDILAICIRY